MGPETFRRWMEIAWRGGSVSCQLGWVNPYAAESRPWHPSNAEKQS